ncbi:MAG TPA: MOSC N-terminal beta barrel domain-containing protein [Candidatus Acidoferrales bacterium]|jgi:hypothetical protein|nr:MOSC N-terminal beta barrel domain-containing protein [Candidatus Acidoferrales bacterium]
MGQAAVGRVLSLWRYPVKSMIGEQLDRSDVTERGLLGDRAYAVVDTADGSVVSAKNPRKWPKMFFCEAAFTEAPSAEKIPPVRITLPSGTRVSSEQTDVHQILSAEFGREVTLRATPPGAARSGMLSAGDDGLVADETVSEFALAEGAPAGTFFDYATILLLTTATLGKFEALYPAGRFEPRRFRPNLLIETASGDNDFVENSWVGRTLAIGDEIRLRVQVPCPRCVMTTLPQNELPHDPGILRTAAQHNKLMIPEFGKALACVGVYAAVARGGVLRRGDACRLE